MAAYMPSFMSKHLSTGAEAAFGQPLAFTTGAGPKTAAGTKTKSGKEKKKNAKKRKEKKAKAAKVKEDTNDANKPKEPKQYKKNTTTLLLKTEDRTALKRIKMDHVEARMTAFTESTDSKLLNAGLRAATATSLQEKINIFKGYYVDDKGNENAKMKRMRKELTYFQSPPTRTDSRKWTTEQFTEFKQIYTNFYSEQLAGMRSDIVTNMREIIRKAVAQKKSDLLAFYSKYPQLMPQRRETTTGS